MGYGGGFVWKFVAVGEGGVHGESFGFVLRRALACARLTRGFVLHF